MAANYRERMDTKSLWPPALEPEDGDEHWLKRRGTACPTTTCGTNYLRLRQVAAIKDEFARTHPVCPNPSGPQTLTFRTVGHRAEQQAAARLR
jgi:hypothetical protein